MIQKEKIIRRITLTSLICNLILTFLKFFLGVIGKSYSVIADAFHSLSDILTDLVILIGVKYWEPPADKEHPYGHKKIESIITLLIGIFLGIVGVEILSSSFKNIIYKKPVEVLWIATIGPALSIIVKEILFQITYKTGEKIKSTALKANAWHHRSDALSSIPALIAVIIGVVYPKLYFIDSLGAFLVALFIFKVAYDIIKPAFMILIDSGATGADIKKIEEIALSVDGVKSIHKLRTRKISEAHFIDLHIQVNGNLNVWEGHAISEKVKSDIIKKGPNIIDVVVHLEPYNE